MKTTPFTPTSPAPDFHPERGNMLFMILIAIVLIGALTAAISSGGGKENAQIDKENLIIKASEVQRYASELERAVLFINSNGHSESDIRFSHPDAHTDYGDLNTDTDKTDQVFHRSGGGANYRTPPSGVNDGSAWEFYAGTHLPGVGSERGDIIAVLPHVTAQFCAKVNAINNQNGTVADTGVTNAAGNNAGSCLNIGALGRIDSTRQFYTVVNTNTVDETTFEQDPVSSAAYTALQACVRCSLDTNSANGLNDEYHFYHVLLAR